MTLGHLWAREDLHQYDRNLPSSSSFILPPLMSLVPTQKPISRKRDDLESRSEVSSSFFSGFCHHLGVRGIHKPLFSKSFHSFLWEALLKEASLFLPCIFFPSYILLSHCLPCSGFSADESGMCCSPHLRLRDLCGQEPHPCI